MIWSIGDSKLDMSLAVCNQCSPAKFVALAQGLQTVHSLLSACSEMVKHDIQSVILQKIFIEVLYTCPNCSQVIELVSNW
jgi:hypothetical protein